MSKGLRQCASSTAQRRCGSLHDAVEDAVRDQLAGAAWRLVSSRTRSSDIGERTITVERPSAFFAEDGTMPAAVELSFGLPEVLHPRAAARVAVRYSACVRFEPNLVVVSAEGGSYALLVEVKRVCDWAPDSLQQLKQYMITGRSPLAVLVTPDAIEILRDAYTDYTPASIESVGRFAAPSRLAAAADDAERFERAVHEWLEDLRTETERERLDPALRHAVEEHLLPVLLAGEVRTAGPRPRLTGTG